MEEVSFGQWMQRRRRALLLTQAELADQVGVATATIRKLEADERRPSRDIAERLATTLHIPPDALPSFVRFARGDLEPPPPSPPSAPRFASPAAASTHTAQVPAPLTPLVGRAAEAAAVGAYLERRDVRLVTLVGPPGIGKTRLALQVAQDLASRFADGTAFVALAAINDPALVLPSIAQAVGLEQPGSQPLLKQLTTALRDAQVLLVVDNCEHVVAAAPDIVALLHAAPGLTVLATSRSPLHLAGEYEYAVPTLGCPPPDQVPSLADLEAYDAVRLLIARAQAVQHDFRLTAQNAPAVAELCRRLDGLPLAIELAAVRLKLFTPAALLTRLRHRLDVLTGGSRDLPARHHTLRAAIAWSYELLTPAEQRLFARLGVFADGWTLDDVEAVCADSLERQVDVLDQLTVLVHHSLVARLDDIDDEARFGMLESIREFALDLLSVSGEEQQVRRQHAEHYVAMAERVKDTESAMWLARLAWEHANIRLALRWLIAQRAAETALRLASAVTWFWIHHGAMAEASMWLDQALALDEPVKPTVRAQALGSAGGVAWRCGAFAQAAERLEAGMALFEQAGDTANSAWLGINLARAVMELGDGQRAASLASTAAQQFIELGEHHGAAWARLLEGTIALRQGNMAVAEEHFSASQAHFRAQGKPLGEANTLLVWAELLHISGDYQRAAAAYQHALKLFYEFGDKPGIALAIKGIAATQIQHLGDGGGRKERCRAAFLFGAAHALLIANGSSVQPSRVDPLDAAVERLRRQIDEATLEAAWNDGAQASLAEATARALGSA